MRVALAPIDIAIIAAYLLVIVGKSLLLTRKAAGGARHYFLAGREMPWWALGASGMSSNLDIAGTVTIISLVYLYGLHGFFIEMRGGVVLPIAVFLAFMGKWHQRSDVVTTGEWMALRFGEGRQAKLARVTAAGTYVIITVSMVVFFLVATGEFLPRLLPVSETGARLLMAGVMMLYTMISGLYGVIWTDVLQAGLLGVVAVYLSVTASGYVDAELLGRWPGAGLNTIVPELLGGLPAGPSSPAGASTVYTPFVLFLVFWIGKGVLEGLGGSGGSAYMAQRFYAAKDAPTVKRLCMFWTVLFAFRWPMVLAFVVLGIRCGVPAERGADILPAVLASGIIPPGMLGIVLVGILAASMSTFDSTINAGASYIVRDFVLPLRPGLQDRAQVRAGYWASGGLVLAGVAVSSLMRLGGGPSANAVLDVWRMIVVQLFPAFLVPFALRWFWSRFNGAGFTTGITIGFLASLGLSCLPRLEGTPHLSPWIENGRPTDVFFLGGVCLLSLLGCLAGTLLTTPTPALTLERFYEQIRPFGLWPGRWKRGDAGEHRADVARLLIALVWQCSTFLLPMTAFLRMWTQTLMVGAVWAVCGLLLLREGAKPRRGSSDDLGS